MFFLLLTQYTRHNLDTTDGNLFENREIYYAWKWVCTCGWL